MTKMRSLIVGNTSPAARSPIRWRLSLFQEPPIAEDDEVRTSIPWCLGDVFIALTALSLEEAFFPCGCSCSQDLGYFDHVKELHKPTVYLESEKEKWLEKVRPIAKDLYEEDDEEDEED